MWENGIKTQGRKENNAMLETENCLKYFLIIYLFCVNLSTYIGAKVKGAECNTSN